MKRNSLALAIMLGLFCSGVSAAAPGWPSVITSDPPGNFPPLRPVEATYRFGWSGFTAGVGQVHFTQPSIDRFQVEGKGGTIGFVRALWKLDVHHRALADAETLRPLEMEQTESYRRKKFVTQLTFTNIGVKRTRTEAPSAGGPSTKQFDFPNLFDMHSATLYLRSQSLKNGTVYRIVVYPATTPYLATLTVTGRERVAVYAGTYQAIKLDLHLNKVGKNLDLEPHKKFRRATIWVSDDPDRILLRIEAQIFVGTVFAELQSIKFDAPKS
jgi:Protein of unknown function (DUF3108)